MKYGWFIRGKRTKLFVRVSGSVLLASEKAADATMFPSAMAAQAFADSVVMAPELEVVDYAIHDPIPPDADQTPVLTRAEVIQAAKDEDRPREAQRRATWGLIEKAVAVLAVIAALLMCASPDQATASPRDHHPSTTNWSHVAHDSLRRHTTRANHDFRAHYPRHARHYARSHFAHRSVHARAHYHNGVSVARQIGAPTNDPGNASAAAAVAVAERYLGGNPTGRASLWCADFANFVERQLGRAGTGSREALSFLRYGPHITNPAPGDIVVLARGRGHGHVGYLIKQTPAGPLVVSGNHNHRVGIGVYNQHAVIAYVRPS